MDSGPEMEEQLHQKGLRPSIRRSDAEVLKRYYKVPEQTQPPEYDLIRKEEAKNLGIRTSTLDKEVAKLRKKQATEDESFEIPIDPWPDAVNGEQLLDEIHRILSCHVVAKQEVLETATLWSAFTKNIDVVRVTPIAIISPPQKKDVEKPTE